MSNARYKVYRHQGDVTTLVGEAFSLGSAKWLASRDLFTLDPNSDALPDAYLVDFGAQGHVFQPENL